MNKELLADTSLSHYRIIAPLGAGGMGEVYLAEDTRLKRKVALKLLPAELTADADRVRRFEQEAQAASALNHPNIITVHDIGECEAGRFIVMELVAGRTLREVIAADNSLETVLTLGQQMARALSAAHAAGITHRDIKPDNIMVRDDGYVKVLDFGLARLLPATAGGEEAATLAQQTTPGTMMGTVAYMSPEQASGQSVSPSSDIFALGIVLYELATGRHPFKADTLVGYLHAITLQTPAPLISLQPKLPVALNDLILRMLDKNAGQRPAASEVAQALQEIERRGDAPKPQTSEGGHSSASDEAQTLMLKPTTAAVPGAKATGAERAQPATAAVSVQSASSDKLKTQKWWIAALLILLSLVGGYFGYRSFTVTRQIESIAVLPFVNASGNAEAEYLSDGMTETLISSLSHLPKLSVKARSSVFRYKGREFELPKIAQELNVQAILTGRVAQRGEQLTLSLELVNTQTENIIWSEQYNRRQADLVTLQSEIARDVAGKLKSKLSGAEEVKVTKSYTSNPEAYRLYLQGKFYWGKRTKANMLKAIEYYKQAIGLDPAFAQAWVGIADVYNSMGKNPEVAPREAIPLAKEAALRALALDPALGAAQAALADSYAIYDWNWVEVERGFKRALELDPNVSYVHLAYATSYLAPMKRTDEAVAELNRSLELEPLSLISNAVLVSGYLYARQNDKALEQGRKAFDLDPGFGIARFWLGLACIANGKFAEAITLGEGGLQKSPSSPEYLFLTGRAYALAGRRREAQQFIDRLRAVAQQQYVRTYWLACLYAALGEKDQAFAELEKSFADKDCFLPRLSVDPALDALRDDPRFKNLLQRMNLPE